MLFLTLKALHIVAMVTWMAGLLYLPRLYVYHANTQDQVGIDRFKIMERKLLWGITTPGAVLTIALGLWMLALYPPGSIANFAWIKWKLALVALLVIHHVWCVKLWRDFKYDRNRHSHVWYRWFNEAPVLVLIGIVFLVVFKP